ncbi:MAG: response regulator transcription factor [Bacteroidota bacterium]
MITVVLVEDQPIYRDGLRMVLEEVADMEVVGEASHGKEALEVLAHTQPKVVLLDINMPILDGLQTVPLIQESFPETEIIMLTVYDEPKLIVKFFDLEVAGYLLKEATRKEIEEAIRIVARGGTAYGVEVMKRLTNHLRQQKIGPSSVSLSKREMEVVRLILEEYTAPEIAQKLFISKETVDTHRKNIREKLQVRNTAGIVREVIRLGLFDLDQL